MHRPWVVMVAMATLGCGTLHIVHDRAVRELGCKDVGVESIAEGTYVATGCGKTATYTCTSSNVGQTMYTRSACVRDDPPSNAPIVVTAAPTTQSSAPSQFPPPTGAGGFELGISTPTRALLAKVPGTRSPPRNTARFAMVSSRRSICPPSRDSASVINSCAR